MYSPKIDEILIPRIYRTAKKHGVKMTVFVNRILERELVKAEAVEQLGYMMDSVKKK